MTFTSVTFLMLFLPVCVIVNYFMQERYRNFFICVMSAWFYSWNGIRFLVFISFLTVVTYFISLLMQKTDNSRKRNVCLLSGLFLNIGILVYYKYFVDVSAFSVVPAGISFYLFSILSYLLDIYWGTVSCKGTVGQLYLYILFFPKVIQGPVMNYSDFTTQLNKRKISVDSLNYGFEKFVKGMVKKVMIADRLAPLSAYSFQNIAVTGTIPAWIGIIAYMLQLYYDFSGYSDMAIGTGAMLGFVLPDNFQHPYLACSVSEYWRRWHITLGKWFRTYVYTPVCKGLIEYPRIRKLKNPLHTSDLAALFVTWLLIGIWHGSEVKFVIHGLWFYVFIALERWESIQDKKRKHKKKRVMARRLRTMAAILFGMVLFRADSFGQALEYCQKMIKWNTGDGILFLHQINNYHWIILAVGTIFCFPVYEKIKRKMVDKNLFMLFLYRIGIIIMYLLAFCYTVSSKYTAFLYEVF